MSRTDIKAKVGLDISAFNKKLGKMERALKRSLNNMERIGNSITRSVTLPAIAMGGAAVQSAVKLDQLQKGLKGIMGSAALAADEFDRLRILAKDPGMSLKSVVEGSIKLQAIGYDAGKAADQMKILGNAIALVGGGGEALSGVTLAMTQILGKGKVHAEEINQMAERLPQIRKAMEDAFGTADTEVLQKMKIGAEEFIDGIIGELGKLPKAQKTLADQFQHMRDDLMVLGASLGQMLIPYVMKAIGFVKNLLNVWMNFSDATKRTIIGIVAAFAVGGPLISGLALFAKGILGIIGKFNLWKLGIAAVVTALYIVYKNWDWIKEKIDKARESFANFKNSHQLFNNAWEETKARLFKGLEAIKLVGNASANTVGALTNAVWKLTRGDITGAWDAIGEGGANTIQAWKDMTKNIEEIEGMKALNLLMGEDAPKKPSAAMAILGEWGDKIKELTGEAKTFIDSLFGDGGSGSASPKSPSLNVDKSNAMFMNGSGFDFGAPVISTGLDVVIEKLSTVRDVAGEVGSSMGDISKNITKGLSKAAIYAEASFGDLMEAVSLGWLKISEFTWENIEKIAEGVSQLAQEAIGIVDQVFDNREARLENYYDKEKRAIENSLKTEEQKAKAIEALDQRTDMKRRELARKKAVADKTGAIFQSIINGLVGISTALAAGNPILAGIIGTLAAANTAAIAAQPLPGFAKGGVFSGENAIRVGEYPNARFNPEVVAPLDKLENMMGRNRGGGGMVGVYGTLRASGQDLVAVLETAKTSRNRRLA